ncbi:MAG: type II toxin-antitoxin system HicB family antitoxin [Prevotella sp.]|nr:type II toxin-antitoxin system HicB family antitoxin [Prevotella sp.]
MHSRIAMLAQESGITINAFIRQTLEKAVCL